MPISQKIKRLLAARAERPDPEHSYGAFIVGDDYAVLAIAEKRPESDENEEGDETRPAEQLDFDTFFPGFNGERPFDEDSKGDFRTYRLEMVRFHLDRNVTPGVELIKRAFLKCWNSMQSKGAIQYKRFYLCLPAWSCKGMQVQEEIGIGPEGQTLFDVHSRIRARHVQLLQDQAVLTLERDGYEAVDLRAHSYTLDTGRNVMPPENETSTTLELNGYVTLAHGALLRELLTVMRKKMIRVDRIITPADACGGMLYNDHLQYGAVVVEIGSRHTACSYYEYGHLLRQETIPVGSDHVFHDISCVERVPVTAIRNRLQDDSADLVEATPFSDLVFAARFSVSELASQVFELLQIDPVEEGAQMNHVVVLGDDRLSCEAFRDYLNGELRIPCGYPSMQTHELTGRYGARDAWRLLGMFELATNEAIESRRLYAIEKYMRPVEGQLMLWIEVRTRRVFRKWKQKINRVIRQVHAGLQHQREDAMRRL